jgi:hypothetical protein
MKNKNFALCALGLAAAITIGGAESASAQRATSGTRIPVRKDQGGGMAATPAKTDTVIVTRVDTVTMRGRTDTVMVTRYDTVVRTVLPPLHRLASTFFGLGAGVAIPSNNWRNSTKDGLDFQAQLGHYFGEGPIGIRIDGNYALLHHRDTDCKNCPNPKIASGSADLLVRFPLDRRSTLNPILYFMGGGGVDKITDFLPYRNSDNKIVSAGSETYLTYPGLALSSNSSASNYSGDKSLFYHYEAGAGLEFDVGPAHLFVESRYKTLNTTNGNSHYFPVVAGFNFY